MIEDWDIKLNKQLKLFFSQENDTDKILYESAIFNYNSFSSNDISIEKIQLTSTFKLRGKRWISIFSADNDYIYCEVKFVLGFSENEKLSDKNNKIVNFITIPLQTLIEKEMSELIISIKNIIWKDYWERGDGESREENSPTPSDPVFGELLSC